MGQFDDDFDYHVFGARKGRTPRPVPTWDYSQVTWTTNAGEAMFVKDMESSHRQNCLNLLVRRHGKAQVLESLIGKTFLFYGARLRDNP